MLTKTLKHHLSAQLDDEFINFLDDEEDEIDLRDIKPWQILVTDDDQTVHDSTVLALNGVMIQGRPLEFLHAFSAREGRDVLLANPETAVILLDVVMETIDAGLCLVDTIRGELQRQDLRIVIRSGQPGGVHTSHESYRSSVDAFTIKSKITRSGLIDVLEEVLIIPPPASHQISD
ncbi:hypothetical protein [Solimicrobium silvestre]|nr:hypothetical protein [Solimicrobium silvestre]